MLRQVDKHQHLDWWREVKRAKSPHHSHDELHLAGMESMHIQEHVFVVMVTSRLCNKWRLWLVVRQQKHRVGCLVDDHEYSERFSGGNVA